MTKFRVLVVDDEEGMLEVCRDALARLQDVEVVTEQDSTKAAGRLTSESFDLLLSDIRMPKMDGVALLRHAREHQPGLPVLILTAFPTVESAVESMKLGATDYITKPFLPDDLVATVRRLLETQRLEAENRLLQRQIERPYVFGEIIGQSPGMKAVFDRVQRVAGTDVDVIVVGETGTGKELVAQTIHRLSPRAQGRFVPIDCGAIPDQLLESEFFGYERGAFTGANARSIGLLEFADRGTLFLDEIGELPLSLQAKLLRALQERSFRRIGGHEEIAVNVRVIAATNRDLAAEIKAGRFREDLYYRINVARIEVPPLRERPGDVELLISHFTEKYARDMGKGGVVFDPEALEILTRYFWHGNVRELQNVLKRTIAMAPSEKVGPQDLPDDVVGHAGADGNVDVGGFFDLRAQRMDTFEKEYFVHLLESVGGDVSRAAKMAKVPRGTLYRFLKKHAIVPEEFR